MRPPALAGYQYSDNSLVDGGMWFLKKLKNSTSLHQAPKHDTVYVCVRVRARARARVCVCFRKLYP